MSATSHAANASVARLRAADLMSTPVLSIPEVTPLREAARMLSRSSISGAPVIDAEGRCVGVLSSTDFVTFAGEATEPGQHREATTFIAPWGELVSIDESADEEIRRYMTAQPITVAPTTPITEVAQKMADAHIHRVLVTGEDRRPCGIVTSTDILAAVAREPRPAPAAKKASRPRGRRTSGQV
jgi:CBS domain-containing protein